MERVAKLGERLVDLGPYVLRGDVASDMVREIAEGMGLKLRTVTEEDLKRLEEVLSKGEPLSKIILENRESE